MRSGLGKRYWCSTARSAARSGVRVAVFLACSTNIAGAHDLSRFVSDLYQGDGINVQCTSGCLSNAFNFRVADSSREMLDFFNEELRHGVNFVALSSSPVSSVSYDLGTGELVRARASLGPLIGLCPKGSN